MTFKQIVEAPIGTQFAFIYRDIRTHNVAIMRKTSSGLVPGNKLAYDGISLQSGDKSLAISRDEETKIPVTKESAEWYHTDVKSFGKVKLIFVRYMLRPDWDKLEINL